MYVITEKSKDPEPLIVLPGGEMQWDESQETMREWLAPQNLRAAMGDHLDQLAEKNDTMRQIIAEKDVGKPGHYWERDIMIEGEMPLAVFMLTHLEFKGDPDWYKDDGKFQEFMKRNPIYSYLR